MTYAVPVNPLNIKLYDIVAFATRRNPSKIQYIFQVTSMKDEKSKGFSLGGTRYNVRTWDTMWANVSSKSTQLLVNSEIPKKYRDELLAIKFKEMDESVNLYEQSLALFRQYKDKREIAVYENSVGQCSIILEGDGREPILEITKMTKDMLDVRGWLHGNSLYSFKNRKVYDFKTPDIPKGKNAQIGTLIAWAHS